MKLDKVPFKLNKSVYLFFYHGIKYAKLFLIRKDEAALSFLEGYRA